jgi:hypothetical protein
MWTAEHGISITTADQLTAHTTLLVPNFLTKHSICLIPPTRLTYPLQTICVVLKGRIQTETDTITSMTHELRATQHTPFALSFQKNGTLLFMENVFNGIRVTKLQVQK